MPHRSETGGSRRARAAARLALLLLLAGGRPAAASGDLYDQVERAAVEVLVDGHMAGSGWLADRTGVVVTAAHMVRKPRIRIEVRSPVFGRASATLVAEDRGHDLALLRLPVKAEGYPALSLADRVPAPMSPIHLFSAPQYRHGILLSGTVGRSRPTFEYLSDLDQYVEVIHVSAATPPGTSGGPWLDPAGRVVGVQVGMMRERGNPSGIAFMTPAPPIRALLGAGRTLTTATIGAAFEELWEHDASIVSRYAPSIEGLVLQKVRPGGPAAAAGLKDWDLVLAVDDNPVRLRDELVGALVGAPPGVPVRLTVQPAGGGERRTVEVRREAL